MHAPRNMTGFTLLELLIAVALMAVVALLGWRGLDAVIMARDDITRHSDRLRALANGFGQIEDDLRSAWFTRLKVSREPAILLRKDDAAGFALELLRLAPTAGSQVPGPEAGASGAPPGAAWREGGARDAGVSPGLGRPLLHKVVWRIQGGVLERGAVPWRPGSGEVGGTGWVWQPVVSGVEAGQWRIWLDTSGWLVESPPPIVPGAERKEGDPVPAPPVPGGVELSLAVAGERIVRILSARD